LGVYKDRRVISQAVDDAGGELLPAAAKDYRKQYKTLQALRLLFDDQLPELCE
jgi:hypothetical protein